MTLKTIEGTFVAPQGKFALLVGRFNSFVVESLVSGAVDTLVRHGVSEDNITIIRAPGAFELPLVAQKLAHTSNTSLANAPRAWPRCPWNTACRWPSAY